MSELPPDELAKVTLGLMMPTPDELDRLTPLSDGLTFVRPDAAGANLDRPAHPLRW
jgi:hypothetical protein